MAPGTREPDVPNVVPKVYRSVAVPFSTLIIGQIASTFDTLGTSEDASNRKRAVPSNMSAGGTTAAVSSTQHQVLPDNAIEPLNPPLFYLGLDVREWSISHAY